MADETVNFAPMDERMNAPGIENFDAVVDTAKKTPLFGFPKNNLDRIYEFWTGMPDFSEEVIRMDKATRLTGVPLAEMSHAKDYLKDFVEVAEPIAKSMRDFVAKTESERSWKQDGKPIYEAIRDWDDRDDVGPYEGSITVLLEAISETQGKGWNTDNEMRQKIAQHALEELWTSCDYARLHYAAETDVEVTTIDESSEEKDEFLAALNGTTWTEEEMALQKKKVSALRRAVAEIDDGTFSDNIKVLWDTARGKAKASTTAIDLIVASEDILQNLSSEGAFEWDPEAEADENEDE